MDFDDDMDDLDQILSNLPSEDTINKADDSADELLDILMDEPPPTITKPNIKSAAKSDVSDESSEDETDELKQAEIAALEAKLALLRSQKSKKKKKSKSDLSNSPENEKPKLKVKIEAEEKSSLVEEALCSHKKKFSDCFFCDEKQSKSPIVASTPFKVEQNNEEPSKPNKIESSSKEKESSPKNNGFYGKKERIAHVPKKAAPPKPVEKEPTAKTNNVKRNDKNLSSGCGYEFVGISIRNPMISSAVLDERMKGRRVIKISHIESKMKNYDIEGDWVTMGVLVDKMPQKTTSNGKNFSVWKLSDLGMGSENVLMAFFLFGEVNKEHWKTQNGAVIALLNPSITKRKEDNSISISIDNPKKLMEIGTSRDLATCKGVRKSDGRSCTMFINKQYGDYCEFHVQKAFKKAKAGRMELQSGGSKGPRNGTTSKNQKGHLMNDMKKSIDMGDYHYGGKTLSLSENKKRNNVKLQKTSNGAGSGGGGLRSIVSSDVKALAAKDLQETKMKREKQKLELQGGTEEFKELLNVPTVGARNLHKLLKGDQVKEEEIKVPKSKCNSARSFLRNTKQELLQTNPQLNRNLSPNTSKPDPAQKKRKLCDVEFFETTTPSDKKDKPKKLSVDKRNESNEREMTFESDEKEKRRKSSTDQTTNNLTPNGGDKTNNLTLNSGDKATKRTLNDGDKITKSTLNGGDRTTKSTLNGGDKTTKSTLNGGDKTTKSTLNGGDKTNKATPNGGDKTERKNKENNNTEEPIRKKEKINLNKLIQDKSKAPMLGRGLRNPKSDFEEDFLCYDKYTGEDTSVSQISYGNDKGLTETLERSTNKQQLQQNGPTLKPTKAKLAAIQKIRSKGGIHDNENKKNKQQTSERIQARLENSLNKSNDEGAGDENDEVPKKKRKKGLLQNIFGELDPNSEEAIKLHKAKSKNVGAVRLAEAEREDKYFAALEKKEAMEQKMINTTEIKVRLYACKVCNYKAESLLKKCLDEKHLHVKLPDRIKRFFACKNCKHKAIGYDCLLPKNPCSKCGGSSFERSSMVNERKGPKMGAETLELRGREQKYANSLA